VERETITLLFMEEQSSDANFNQKKNTSSKKFQINPNIKLPLFTYNYRYNFSDPSKYIIQ
jgi:hypothetical protein